MSERRQAATALGRVLREGAWSNVVLRDGSSRTRALLLETLRALPRIDQRIASAAGRAPSKVDSELLDLLRIATTELNGRDARPAAVIVDGAVRDAGSMQRRYRGFANAVLRRIAESAPIEPAVTASDRGVDAWIAGQVNAQLGEDSIRFWEALDRPAPVGIRSAAPVVGAEPVPGIPGAWLWHDGPPPEGEAIQDPASVAVVNALSVEGGDVVADLAAAPGGKTRHLVDLAGPDGMVVAVDVHPRRAATGRRRAPGAAWLRSDGRNPALRHGMFHRVLLDAPCSGLGTLRRRPEVRYRVGRADVERLASLQRELLEAAFDLLAPGGRLVYSVCTFLPEETIDVVAGLGARAPGGLPGRPWGDGWLMSPDRGPTDGMFVSVFDRPGELGRGG